MSNRIVIKEPNPFYSYLDEEHFFSWLESIPMVKSIIRISGGLELTLSETIEEEGLRDLIAVMARYGVDMHCLAKFCNLNNERWLKNKNAYWYEKIF